MIRKTQSKQGKKIVVDRGLLNFYSVRTTKAMILEASVMFPTSKDLQCPESLRENHGKLPIKLFKQTFYYQIFTGIVSSTAL